MNIVYHVHFQTPGSKSRYTFVHNPAADTSGTEPTLASILGYLITTATLKKVAPVQLLEVVDTGASNTAQGQTALQLESTLSNILGELPELDSASYEQYIQASNAVVDILNLAPGERALVVNGRVSDSTTGSAHTHAFFYTYRLLDLWVMKTL